MNRAAVPCLCLLALIVAGGCQRRDANRGLADPPPANEPEVVKRLVAFAPLGLGPLASSYPEARTAFALKLADHIDEEVFDADGQTPDGLPDSDARDWQAGAVPAAAGAYLVVLTRVVDITHEAPMGPRERGAVVALVEMKAVDANDPAGTPVFHKRAKGRVANDPSVKMMGDSARPESVAAWDACETLVEALATLLTQQPEPAPPVSDEWIVVEVDSEPSRADVLVDGAFVGSTPTRIQLPRRKVTVRVERAGYRPWQREVLPSRDMRIQPVLGRVGDGEPAALTPSPMPEVTAPGVSGGTEPVRSPAAGDPSEPAPKRAEIDPTMSPPTPSELVVPDSK